MYEKKIKTLSFQETESTGLLMQVISLKEKKRKKENASRVRQPGF